jgi:hypothetical protein
LRGSRRRSPEKDHPEADRQPDRSRPQQRAAFLTALERIVKSVFAGPPRSR